MAKPALSHPENSTLTQSLSNEIPSGSVPGAPVDTAPASAGGPPPRRRRWLPALFFLAVLLLVTVWFAPTVVAVTDLRHQLVPLALPKFTGKVKIGSANFGWLSPITLRDVTVQQPDGPLAKILLITSDQPLLSMAMNSSAPGLITLTEPVFTIRLRSDGSNVEDALSQIGTASRGGSSEYALAIVHGQIDLTDEVSSAQHRIERIESAIRYTSGSTTDIQIATTADIPTATHTGNLDLKATVKQPSDGSAIGSGSIDLNTADLPLDLSERIVARFSPKQQFGGRLSGTAIGKWSLGKLGDSTAQDAELTLDLTVADAKRLGSSGAINAPEPNLGPVRAAGAISLAKQRLRCTNLAIETTPVRLKANGELTLPSGSLESWAKDLQAAAENESYQLDTTIDLARLAEIIPDALRIREGTVIQSGRVAGRLESQAHQGGNRWSGTVQLSGLEASEQGRPVRWEQPIQADFLVSKTADLWRVENLKATSEFATLSGSGTFSDIVINAKADLNRLTQSVSQVFDLGGTQLAGQLAGTIEASKDGPSNSNINGQVTINGFALASGGKTYWNDPQLKVDLLVKSQVDSAGLPQKLEIASAEVLAGTDRLKAQLLAPVNAAAPAIDWPLGIELTGSLARWQSRLSPVLAINGVQLGGDARLQTQISRQNPKWQLKNGVCEIANLNLKSSAIQIVDHDARIEFGGAFDPKTGILETPKLSLNMQALEITGTEIRVNTTGLPIPVVEGTFQIAGDLGAVGRWMPQTQPPRTWHPTGRLAGEVKLAKVGTAQAAVWDVSARPFALMGYSAETRSWQPSWQEPALRTAGEGTFDSKSMTVNLASAQFSADGLQVDAKGEVAIPASGSRFDLSGNVAYDWDQLSSRLSPETARSLQISGKDSRPFAIKGTLLNPEVVAVSNSTANGGAHTDGLTGNAGIGWATLRAFGMDAGRGQIEVAIENNVLTLIPMDVAVNQGRIKFGASMPLDATPLVVTPRPGIVVEQIHLSPELCADWLKFMAPLISNAARAEGRFSIAVTEGDVLVADPLTSDLAGTITVHTAQVRPGPGIGAIVQLIDQVKGLVQRKPGAGGLLDSILGSPLLGGNGPEPQPGDTESSGTVLVEMPEQTSDLRLRKGRMYHRQLVFLIGGTKVLTTGSVGVDETLSINIDIPIDDRWIGDDRFGRALAGQSIRVPVGGTLSRPRPDLRAVLQLARQLGTQMLQDEIGGKVEGEVGKQIDKLDGLLDGLLKRKK